MNTTAPNPLDAVAEQLRALQAENERLRAAQSSQWQTENQLREANGKASTLQKTVDKLITDNARLERDNRYWRQAVRYEQSLKKKDRKKVRHLPVFNGVRRADRDLYNKLAKAMGGESRLTGRKNPERVFLRHWREENRRWRGRDGGYGVLELILSENSNDHAADITQRDATVAASVVQWLGTNCGQAFLIECEREIEASRKSRVA